MKAREIRKLERARKHKEATAKRKNIDRVLMVVLLAGANRKRVECGSYCLPNTALYAAGYRKSGTITAR
ncbi:hypothetical protein [Escherichia coli]|uniref:transcriptional antitermination N peptide n=1 Tax=Escherichia coli TaxID=562 RepID=UPI000D07AA90|nr:hypothetical protein [Escherichia coli]